MFFAVFGWFSYGWFGVFGVFGGDLLVIFGHVKLKALKKKALQRGDSFCLRF